MICRVMVLLIISGSAIRMIGSGIFGISSGGSLSVVVVVVVVIGGVVGVGGIGCERYRCTAYPAMDACSIAQRRTADFNTAMKDSFMVGYSGVVDSAIL